MSGKATYVFCLVAAARKPSPRRIPSGPAGTGKPRLIDVDLGRALPRSLRGWLVVADAPVDPYNADEINRRLHDLDWVARAAIAHERVIETFVAAPAVLPMKLFTIFTSDDRAVEHLREEPERLRAVLSRVMNHDEWGIRLTLERTGSAGSTGARRRTATTGAGYLSGKKALYDQSAKLATRAREVAADLRELVEKHASDVRGRRAREMPAQNGPLLLDEALLVARTRAAKFRVAIGREERRLAAEGYRVTLTGPWPPYSFLQDQ